MKKQFVAAMMMVAFLLASCATPTGTPEQQAAIVRANADMARGVGSAAMQAGVGIGAALLGKGLGENLSNRAPRSVYHHYGSPYRPYYRPYYAPHPYYGW